MAKKKPTRKRKTESSPRDDDLTEENLLGYFTVAYVLNAVGLLDPAKKKRLDSLKYPDCPSWNQAVEDAYGITLTFVRSVYGLCTEYRSPPESVCFILRGLGCPDYHERLEEVLGLSRLKS